MFLQSSFILMVLAAVVTAKLTFLNSKPLEPALLEDEEDFETSAASDQFGPCSKEYSCLDCNRAQLCVSTGTGEFRPLRVVNCSETTTPSSTPATPFCSETSGTCTTLPSLSCAPTGNFTCVRDGAFPDPADCTKYYVCLNSVAYVYKCDRAGQNYDSSKQSCSSGATCYTFNCRGKHGVKIAYGKTANIFAYCVNSTVAVVDGCLGNYELNADTQNCEPVCSSEGNIPDVLRCTRYYRCVKADSYSSKYTITSEECPQSQGFDARGLRCVPISSLRDCQG